MDIINDFLAETYKEENIIKFPNYTQILIALRPKIYCNDGFNISVQASEFHYCTPRLTFKPNPFAMYTEVECGFPSEKEDLLMDYIDGDPENDDPTKCDYGYVPVSVVEEVIKKHGGIKEETK